MDLLVIAILSLIACATAVTIGTRVFGWKRLMKMHIAADVIVTVTAFLIFSGTLTGTLVAATAGLLFSLVLSAGRTFGKRLDQRLPEANR